MNDDKTQRINVHEGINAHGAMGERNEQTPPEQPQTQPAGPPQELIDEAQRQVQAGAAFFNKPLADCTREELYAATIMGFFEATQLREQLDQLQPAPPDDAA